MSRAFVRDSDDDPQSLPERPVSPQPNFVTARGLAAGATQVWRLVGEDEADAAHGLLGWVSPLAQVVLGCAVGETVAFQGGEAEIVSIEP